MYCVCDAVSTVVLYRCPSTATTTCTNTCTQALNPPPSLLDFMLLTEHTDLLGFLLFVIFLHCEMLLINFIRFCRPMLLKQFLAKTALCILYV